MVITCASLPFHALYFISDVIFLEFTCVPIFYLIIMDICLLFSLFIFYLDITYKIILWVLHFIVLRKNFSSCESLGEVLMVWIIYECKCCFIFFFIPFRLSSNAMFILIIFTLHTPLFALYLFYYY